eukprot:3827889-Amphidinium_carterae.2
MARSEATTLHSVHVRIPTGPLQDCKTNLRRQVSWTSSSKSIDELANGDVCTATRMAQRIVSSKNITNVLKLGTENQLWLAVPPT